jgi:energy-converting hydrogenase Eha subunit A
MASLIRVLGEVITRIFILIFLKVSDDRTVRVPWTTSLALPLPAVPKRVCVCCADSCHVQTEGDKPEKVKSTTVP